MSPLAAQIAATQTKIGTYFPDVTHVAPLYRSLMSLTNYACALRWIIWTRERYVSYYMGIQHSIDQTRNRISANHTYWSTHFLGIGEKIDKAVTEIEALLSHCGSGFKTEFMATFKIRLTQRIQSIHKIETLYAGLSSSVVSKDLILAFPTEIVNFFNDNSIIKYVDDANAIYRVSFIFFGIYVKFLILISFQAEALRYFNDRQEYLEALEHIEYAMIGFNYVVYAGGRQRIEDFLNTATVNALRCVI